MTFPMRQSAVKECMVCMEHLVSVIMDNPLVRKEKGRANVNG